ncbi:uncharacterized protein LOC129909664 [Episyrphus balteatus]|uniref:uncharacterized protein LOC129909664 n=1 Tax=Episyrphus balteatus TaxID=286459 RepID=UPI0024868F7B|nr:uncharacterized protein LOC129909664 [Episyrphus balteatus]
MPKNENQENKKRTRPYQPSHRWTQMETQSMLDLIVEAVKDNPETFEKPTAQKFFQKFAGMSPLLASIDWVCMKSKMRYLKGTYMSAMDWQGKTGAGLLETGEEKSVLEYIKKKNHLYNICPFFDQLEIIFGARKNIAPNIVYQTNYSTDELIEEIQEDDSTYIEIEHTDSFQEDEAPQLSPVSKAKDQMKMPNKKTNKITSSNAIGQLMELQVKKLELETKKFQEEMELKKKKQEQDFELRKLEIEKEERVQRYELELKFKQQ